MIFDHTIDSIIPDINGTISIGGYLILNTSSTVIASGTTQGGATLLTGDINIVTTAAANSGVIFPVPTTIGQQIAVINRGANTVNVYPASGGTINALSTNTADTVATDVSTEYVAVSTTGWTQIATSASGGGGSASAITGGATNEVLYQSGTSTTAFITAPTTATTYLEWNGTAFTWSTVPMSIGTNDVTTTTYTVLAADIGLVKRFTNSSGCTVTVPASLGAGWNCLWERSSIAGPVTFVASSTILAAANGGTSLVALVGRSGAIIPETTDVYQITGILGPNATSLAVGGSDVTTTTYTLLTTDIGIVKRFTNSSGCTITIPSGLGTGWNCLWEKASGAGNLTFVASGTTLRMANGTTSLVASIGLSGAIIPENATDTYQITGAMGPTPPSYTISGIAAAGTTQGTGTVLTAAVNEISTGTGGVVLPIPVPGASIVVFNDTGSTITVYPPTGCQIDAAATNAGVTVISNGQSEYIGVTSTKYETLHSSTFGTANEIVVTPGNGISTLSLSAPLIMPGAATLAAGTTILAPLTFVSGTNLTTAAAGVMEYDGVDFYATGNTTNGRGIIPVEQYFRLTATGATIAQTAANYFGTTSNISLISGASYDIEIYCYFLRSTAGAVTWTFTNSAVPTGMNVWMDSCPVTGISGTPSAPLVAMLYDNTSASPVITTASLTTATNQAYRFRIQLFNGTGTSLKLLATAVTGGTITPGIGSFWRCVRRPLANIGTFAA